MAAALAPLPGTEEGRKKPPAAEPAVALAGFVETDFGGVFYLLNIALYLDLYGDFSSPEQPGIALGPWDFLALVGHRLLGQALLDDPVWPLLARLAGRTGEQLPGEDFAPPDEWRIPDGWLAPFGPSPGWTWTEGQGRLRVFHPEGFAVLDLALGGEPAEAVLARELAAYGSPPVKPVPSSLEAGMADNPTASGPSLSRTAIKSRGMRVSQIVGAASRGDLSSPTGRAGYFRKSSRRETRLPRVRINHLFPQSPALACWLDRLLLFLAARLRRGLGLSRDEDPAPLLCRHGARVYVTDANLDIVLSLAGLPIAVRIAGLDRDPGWIPAAGRFVRFHFE